MNLKIFTENVEPEALEQIYTLAKLPVFKDCKIRIMPDVHAGAGCVIGFTADLGDKVIPNIVGVDIGCGMLTVILGKIDIDYEKLDHVIRASVPSGFEVHEDGKFHTSAQAISESIVEKLRCFKRLKDVDRIVRSIGTLGGGNHFIEVDKDDEDCKYLIIHTGSRNLGKQVADIYQRKAIDSFYNNDKLKEDQKALIEKLKSEGRQAEIEEALKQLRAKYIPYSDIPRELCYLTGQDRDDYLYDMKLCQEWAKENRDEIGRTILCGLGFNIGKDQPEWFHTIHNYIDAKNNMVRKGSISAEKGERVLIPLNMSDGCILAEGKGNEDWNCSAPHGAGRLVSRSEAKQLITLEEYQQSMEGIYTTSVNIGTIDESPMAYKPKDEIISNIQDTVKIIKLLESKYNFKASEE